MKILITEEQYNFLITESTGNKTVDQFIKYAKKRLKIKDPVDIKLQSDRKKMKTTGVYRHEDETKSKTPEVRIYTKDRLLADVIRHIGHELEHHKQNQDDMFPKGTEKETPKERGRFKC